MDKKDKKITFSYGDVEAFFNYLVDPSTPKVKKFYVYNTYSNAIESEKRQVAFESAYPKRPLERYFAHVINDEMAVMEACIRDKIYFTPCLMIDGKPVVNNIYYHTFDDALIAGLCLKHAKSEAPTMWISKMIGIEQPMENGEKLNDKNNK